MRRRVHPGSHPCPRPSRGQVSRSDRPSDRRTRASSSGGRRAAVRRLCRAGCGTARSSWRLRSHRQQRACRMPRRGHRAKCCGHRSLHRRWSCRVSGLSLSKPRPRQARPAEGVSGLSLSKPRPRQARPALAARPAQGANPARDRRRLPRPARRAAPAAHRRGCRTALPRRSGGGPERRRAARRHASWPAARSTVAFRSTLTRAPARRVAPIPHRRP